jgi:hypothetical protein
MKRAARPKESEPTENTTHTHEACSACLCQGAGPALSEILRRMGPPTEARKHFDTARVEILKGIRAILDARIAELGKSAPKGEKITVE